MEIERIVLTTDLSQASGRAAPYAVELAGRYGARLDVLHVAERLVDAAPVAGWLPPEELESAELIDRSRERLRRWVEETLRGVEVHEAVVEGEAAREIVEYARAHACDVIVMGTHGHSAVERFFLGSVTEGVLRRAPCPVLAVPGRPR